MSPADIIAIGQAMLVTALIVAAPLLGFSLLAGLVTSVFQALTQINEIGLTFIIKIVVVSIVLLVLLPWFLGFMMDYTVTLFEELPRWG
jgi:flagellar biosynthetic protein FliQ